MHGMLGISANIMSLAGMAIAFGELIDASIVVVEQTHKKLEFWEATGRKGDYREMVTGAVKEVAGPTLFRSAGPGCFLLAGVDA